VDAAIRSRLKEPMNRKTINEILHKVYRQGLSLQSNFVREFDQEIAALASLRLITTKEAPHQYGRTWRITEEGLGLLREEGYL
jgi:hypothetical protein